MPILSGRIALVTGASSGLGERFAETLRGAGAEVVVTARRRDRLEQLADRSGSVVLAGDIASPDHREALAETIADRFGRLDILVNNAGVCDDGPIEDQTLEDLTTAIQTDLVAVLDLCRLMAPLLFLSDGATVINISSIYGLVASRSPMAAYNASKGALVKSDQASCCSMGSTRCSRERTCPRVFSDRVDGRAHRSQLRREHRSPVVVGTNTIHR